MKNQIKIGTANVNGLGEIRKRQRVFKSFKEKEYDIILLQETHSTRNDERFWNSQWGSKIYYSHGEQNARGVAILFDRKLDYHVHSCETDTSGRSINMTITIGKEKMQIINIYAPNSDSPFFFETIGHQLAGQDVDKKIVAGDFNITIELIDSVKKVQHSNKMAVKMVKTIIEEFNLEDIWRKEHDGIIQYTWRRADNSDQKARLDYMLVTNELAKAVVYTDIEQSVSSDHSIPYLIYKTETNEIRGPGFWRFNTSLLMDSEYIRQIKELITEEKKKVYETVTQKWDSIKMLIRGFHSPIFC